MMITYVVNISSRDWFDYLSAFGPIIAAGMAIGVSYWQGCIQKKQRNIALLEKRLSLTNKLNAYMDERLEKCISPQLNADIWKESYEHLTNIAGESALLFNTMISDKIMNLAKDVEFLKTSIYYNIRKGKGEDTSIYDAEEGCVEKDYGKLQAQMFHTKNVLINEMHLIMREDKV